LNTEIPQWAWTRLAALVAFAWMGLVGCGEAKKAAGAPPPPTVYVATVMRSDVPLFIEAVATLDGYDNADIRARVRGYLQAQNYKDGSAVKRGQELFTIESAEYVSALNAARAALARARVAQARNRIQLERDQGLFKTGMISQQDLDNVAASVGDSDAQVQAAQAQVQQAQLNLSYTETKSPIDGVAGIALVRAGNLVGQDGPTLLTTVSQLDPIRVNFPMSENDFVQYPDRFKHLEARDLTWARAQFARLDGGAAAENGDPGIEIVLSDGSIYPHRGVVVASNRQIDPGTGTIQIQALVPNPDRTLRPGQYGRVRIRRQEAGHDMLVVPEKALISVQGTYSVGVVGPDNKVQLRRLELGPSAKGLRIVSKGIAEGERIVVEGVQKISDGALVDAKAATPGSAESMVPGRPAASKN
jgi:membrane fusion protein, multidrug efflux system